MPDCLDMDTIMMSLEEDANIGFCIRCGAERDCCEPDARGYECEECGRCAVFGAAELLLMYG